MGFLFKHDTVAQPVETETISHNHYNTPSYVSMVMSYVLGFIVTAVAIWQGGIFLYKKVGIENPDESFAVTILILLAIALVVLTFTVIAALFIDKVIAHREAMEDKRLQQAELDARMQRSESVDKREVSRSNKRLNYLIEHIVFEAYHHGEYKPKDNRIWARRTAKEIVLPNETTPVGEAMATRARNWLIDSGVLIGKSGKEVINFKRYPNVASVQRALMTVGVRGVIDHEK